MKNIELSTKTKRIIMGTVAVAIFSAGAYTRPGIDLTAELIAGAFGSNEKQYVAPPSEYETQVNALWKSEKHQAVCKANAAASVSVTLARKYLEEAERQAVLSTYDLPISEAVEKTSNYGKR